MNEEDWQLWLKATFIKGSPAEHLLIFTKIRFTEPSKFEQLDELLSTKFYIAINHDSILDTFCKIQFVNHAIAKFQTIFRMKKALLYNTDDLYMNPINPASKNTIIIFQNNTKYVFHIRELIQSVNTSLSHCCHFFSDPIVCKNPYTNLPFTKSALYNIYFAIKGSTFLIPTLFHRYFLCNFEYPIFCIENETLVNEEYLNTYVENYCLQHVYSYVREMFELHNMRCNIHKKMPKETLYRIMKPYLKLYFLSNFLITRSKKDLAFKMLHKKLHAFIKFNPNFGKRKVKLTALQPFSNRKMCNYYFEDKAIRFITKEEEKSENLAFMKSHLEQSHNDSSSSSEYEEEPEFTFSFINPQEDQIEQDEIEENTVVSNEEIVYEEDEEDDEDDEDDEDSDND